MKQQTSLSAPGTPITQELHFLRAVLDNITEGVVACDMSGHLTLFNCAMREMYGLPLEPILPDQWSAHYSVFCEDGISPMPTEALPLFRALQGERVNNVELILAPKHLPRRVVSVSGQPILDEAGAQLGAVVLLHDITQEKQASQLRDSEARLSALIEAAPSAMVVLDSYGQMQMLNAQAEQLFGYARAELIDQSIERVVPDWQLAASNPDTTQDNINFSTRGMKPSDYRFAIRADGTKVPIEIGLNPFITPDGPMLLAIIIDITARVESEHALKESLREKETLLQEIHHRVKNNLQVISSLLRLQSELSSNEEVQRTLNESQLRIKAIALSHQLLYENKDFSRIHLQQYVIRLGKLTATTYARNNPHVELHFDLPPIDIYLDLHRAIPCGLIITELIINAYKHAFPEQAHGDIHITMQINEDDSITLSIRDSGVGLPPTAQLGAMETLGFQLIPILAEQVGAQLESNSDNGTQFTLRFKPFFTRKDNV